MDFRFTLTHNISGTLVLTKDPKGWQDASFLIRRDEKYHGLFLDFSVKLGFYCNGAGKEFIDNIYDTYGIDEVIEILIETDCGANTEQFKGKLNLASYQIEEIDGTPCTSVNIEQAGIAQLVKNRSDIKIDLHKLETLDGTVLTPFTFGEYDLNMHSKEIIQISELGYSSFPTDPPDHVFVLPISATRRFGIYHDYPLILNDLHETTSNPASEEMITGSVTDLADGNNFHDADDKNVQYPINVLVEYDFSGEISDSTDGGQNRQVFDNITLQLRKGATMATSTLAIVLGSIGGYTTTDSPKITAFDFTGSATISLSAGENLYLLWFWNGYLFITGVTTGTATISYTYDSANIKLTAVTTKPATTAKAFVIHEALARVSQSITDQTDALRSEYFGRTDSEPNSYADNGCGAFLALTNGYAIRKFNLDDYPIVISLNEIFEALNAIYNIGLGIEEGGSDYVVRIEPKSYFYDSATVLLQMPNIPNLKLRAEEKYYYNEIEIGYDKWETEDINGADEFNIKHQYSIPMKVVKNKVTALSEVVTGMYAIELTRRKQYVDFPTLDSTYDTDNFFIALNRSVDYSAVPTSLNVAEKNENYQQVNNIISPATAYNLRLSPKRNLLRWMGVLASGLLKKAGELLKFTAGEANTQMTSEMVLESCPENFNSALLTENSDLAWDNVNIAESPIWQPEVYEFEYPLSFTDYLTLRATPTGCIEFTDGLAVDGYKKGFILEVNYKPNSGKANFKLLRAN